MERTNFVKLVWVLVLFLVIYNDMTIGNPIPGFNRSKKPLCQNVLKNDPNSPKGYDLQCFCDGSTRRYSGSLTNFLRTPIRRLKERTDLSVLMTNCRQLKLKLDTGKLLESIDVQSFNLTISKVNRVLVENINLAFDKKHRLEVEAVKHRFSLSGVIECYKCPNETNSSSTQSKKYPSSISIEVANSRQMSIYNLHSRVPFQLTARNMESLYVTQSIFETLPWPGFYFYNVSKSSITRNEFRDSAPKALVAKLGSEIVLSDNILDVSTSLDVSLYNHMTIKCNIPTKNYELPAGMACPSHFRTRSPFIIQSRSSGFSLFMTILSNLMFWGSLGLVLVTLILLLCWCAVCCKCGRNKQRRKKNNPQMTTANDQSPPKIIVQEVKQPTSILKQKPQNFDPIPDSSVPENKPEKYVTVDSVKEDQDEITDAGQVVHGSLTLGGEWPDHLKTLRAVSEERTDDPDETKKMELVSEVVLTAKPEDKQNAEDHSEEKASTKSKAKSVSPPPPSKSPEGKKSSKKPAEKKTRITRSELKTLQELRFAEQEEYKRNRRVSGESNKGKSKSPSRSRSPSADP